MGIVRWVLPILCLGLLRVAVPAAAPPPYYAIRDARIVPVTGPVIERGTIVLSDGLITAVGTSVTVPPEAEVIDGTGLTVYPGLIDALTTIGLPDTEPPQAATDAPGGPPPQATPSPGGPRRPASRGPEDRPGSTPWQRAADNLDTDDRRIVRWRSAGFTTAVVASGRGIFPGQASVVNLAGERPGDMVVASSVALPVSLQPQRRSAGRSAGFPSSLMGVLAYVHQVFLDTQHATRVAEAYAKAPRGQKRPEYDRTVDALAQVLADGRLVLLPATNRTETLRMLDFARELELRVALYGAHGAYEVADEIAAHKVPVLLSVKWPERPKDADPEADESLRVLRLRDRAPSTPAALTKANVKFAFYSDGLETPTDVLTNLRRALDAGLARDAALRAFTRDAAEIFGLDDRLGSLETGKIANVLVTDGDLFDEKTTVKLVFVDGQKFEPVAEPTRPDEKPTTSEVDGDAQGGRP
ncbi:MAG: amidohydrolase family protein [Luteitalea sp.]|nr:amidohydrolase family protein [Luteitalea sp.]